MSEPKPEGYESAAPELFPPGTVFLERHNDNDSKEILLHPQPTQDPNDPLNWSKAAKALNFGLSSFYTLMVFVLVDIGTVIYGPLMDELGFSVEILNWSFGACTAGLAIGCVLFIPFALKFGRRPVYLVSIAVCLGTAIWQGVMTTEGDQMGSNAVSGLGGAVAETICQMTIADLFFVHQRATANGIYLVMVNMGAFLAPLAAGYAADAQGWRWIWWWTTIFLGVCLVLFALLYEDTKYTPVLSQISSTADPSLLQTRKPSVVAMDDERRRSEGDKNILYSEKRRSSKEIIVTDAGTGAGPMTLKRKTYVQRLSLTASSPGNFGTFFRHTYQPFILLFTLPAVAYTAIIYGSLLAWFSVVVSTLSIYFVEEPYNFTSSGIGLMNLPPFIGSVIGSIYGGYLSDWLIVVLARRNKGIFEPEMRLWLALLPMVLGPAGIAMFGISMAKGAPWIIPAIGAAIFGFSFGSLADIALTYLMDCYKDLVGDALVAVAFIRNALATALVFALAPWIEAIGLQNMFICCTFISLALFLTTIPMLIWGKTFRIKTRKQFEKMKQRQFATRG